MSPIERSGGGGGGGTQGTEIGYDQITANVTVSSATEATGTTVISCAAHTFDGGPVLANFFSPIVIPGLGDAVVVCLFEGATEIGRLMDAQQPAAGNAGTAGNAWLRFTPTAASHTYTVTAFRVSNNGTIFAGTGGVGGFLPCFIRFTKV